MGSLHENGCAPLAALDGASLSRGGGELLANVTFRLLPGERWAVLGENGAGKTTFLRLLRGEITPDVDSCGRTTRTYDLPGAGGPQPTPLGLRQRLPLVSGDMQDAYVVRGWRTTGLDVVLSGFQDSALVYAEPTPEEYAKAFVTLVDLDIVDLADRRMADLSTGQARKILLARALACDPDVLLLDECLEGLDAPSRRDFLDALDLAAANSPSLAMLFTSHRTNEMPACLNRGLVLRDGRIFFSGELAGAVSAAASVRPPAPDESPRAKQNAPIPQRDASAPTAGFLTRISHASLEIDGTRILDDVSWTVLPGENWAVLGENGAGKSTLISLLSGATWPSATEIPPGTVEHGFAKPGETLDDARRRIGLVSPALQANFPYDPTTEEVVWTGLEAGRDIYERPGEPERQRAAEWLEFFALGPLATRRVRSLSRGQFRRVLLARAMLAGGGTRPDLLLLDEPVAGLDARSRKEFGALLERLAASGTPLVVVTHHLGDLPACFNRVLEMAHGRAVFTGSRAEYERRTPPARHNGTVRPRGERESHPSRFK